MGVSLRYVRCRECGRRHYGAEDGTVQDGIVFVRDGGWVVELAQNDLFPDMWVGVAHGLVVVVHIVGPVNQERLRCALRAEIRKNKAREHEL